MVDASLLKRMRISEELNLQFRAEAFNVLNHPNFSYPNEVLFQGTEYSPSGGVITATAQLLVPVRKVANSAGLPEPAIKIKKGPAGKDAVRTLYQILNVSFLPGLTS